MFPLKYFRFYALLLLRNGCTGTIQMAFLCFDSNISVHKLPVTQISIPYISSNKLGFDITFSLSILRTRRSNVCRNLGLIAKIWNTPPLHQILYSETRVYQ